MRGNLYFLTKEREDGWLGEECIWFSGTPPQLLGKASKKWTHRAIDEDPQKFSPNGLQLLAVVQLTQDDFILQDVVLQDNPEQPLIHGHHFSCKQNSTVCLYRMLHKAKTVNNTYCADRHLLPDLIRI